MKGSVQVQTGLAQNIKPKFQTSSVNAQTSWLWISFDRLSRILHCSCAVIFMGVWLWHFTPAAQALPGSTNFGWFFRYLTYCSFTLQTFWLLLCITQTLFLNSNNNFITVITDDMACALFPLTNLVTILYYTLELVTAKLVEGGEIARPPWLDFAVHSLNSLVLWLDLLFSNPRTFSFRSKILSFLFASGYFVWMLVMKFEGGGFPYPFLEDLPFPEGFLVMYLSSVALFALLYMFGVLLRRMVEARAVVVQVKRPSHRGILFLDVSGAALAAVLAIYIFT